MFSHSTPSALHRPFLFTVALGPAICLGFAVPSAHAAALSADVGALSSHAGARQEVIDYCVQDVQSTLELANVTERKGRLTWRSRAGNPQFLPIPGGWKTVNDALRIPEPDTSWMRQPLSRSQFTAWFRG